VRCRFISSNRILLTAAICFPITFQQTEMLQKFTPTKRPINRAVTLRF